MAELVQTKQDVIENVLTLARYAKGDAEEKQFHKRRIANGRLFVVLNAHGTYRFAPNKFAGYLKNDISHGADLDNRDGRTTNRRIEKLLGPCLELKTQEHLNIDQAFLKYCRSLATKPSKHHRERRYWTLANSQRTLAIPEEIDELENIFEGAIQRIFVNKYERSQAARQACLDRFGYTCSVCAFDFEARYGALGKQYIHVHHLVPLSTIKKAYKIDPKRDLRPVCPNCHAMLHKEEPAMSITKLRSFLSPANAQTQKIDRTQ
jgi:5-methylcytosine-specific restriction protein A